MPRNYTIRKMRDMDDLVKGMEYPYGYISESISGYPLETIRRPIIVEPEQVDAGNFPHNIQEHFWIRLGENDGDSWLSTGVLTNGNYFFYTGSCDYTGFDCQGGMCLWVSSWENIIEHAMSESQFECFRIQTSPHWATDGGR